MSALGSDTGDKQVGGQSMDVGGLQAAQVNIGGLQEAQVNIGGLQATVGEGMGSGLRWQ